jgi:hypothetical protein
VGTTSGQTRWGQPSDPNDRKGRQERSKTGWCYLRQGSGNSWAKVSTSPDQDSRGGEATKGLDQYGVEVVHWPPLQRPEDRKIDILQPAPGAARMGHLLRAVKVTGFMIKWGAHLSTLAAGVWMLHGMVVIKLQANK